MKEDKFFCACCEHSFIENHKQIDDVVCVSSMSQEYLSEKIFCRECGQEIKVFDGSEEINLFLSAVGNKNLKVVAYTAPSIRTSLAEAFGLKAGSDQTARMVEALKLLGADFVFDMNFAADLTTVEEATEFILRLKEGKNLPMFTSCCPAWVSFVERAYPSLKGNLSSCKSPQQMFGAILNNYFAKKLGIDNTELFVVSVVPCVAKKLERKKQSLNTTKGFDVDCTLTTLDLINLIKMKNIDFAGLAGCEYDNEFNLSSGAGIIFGNSGGVMEAIISSASKKDKEFETKSAVFDLIRGKSGVRECEFQAFGKMVKIACVSGLKKKKKLLEDVKNGTSPYSFIEVMACDGGCVGGGGQPLAQNRAKQVNLRAKGLYNRAKHSLYKSSFENPAIIKLYENFLGEYGGPLAQKLLHVKRT